MSDNTFFTIPPWSCPLCKNESTHVELRNWTKRDGVYETIKGIKQLVCPHCVDSEGNGYAFRYVDKSKYAFDDVRGWITEDEILST